MRNYTSNTPQSIGRETAGNSQGAETARGNGGPAGVRRLLKKFDDCRSPCNIVVQVEHNHSQKMSRRVDEDDGSSEEEESENSSGSEDSSDNEDEEAQAAKPASSSLSEESSAKKPTAIQKNATKVDANGKSDDDDPPSGDEQAARRQHDEVAPGEQERVPVLDAKGLPTGKFEGDEDVDDQSPLEHSPPVLEERKSAEDESDAEDDASKISSQVRVVRSNAFQKDNGPSGRPPLEN